MSVEAGQEEEISLADQTHLQMWSLISETHTKSPNRRKKLVITCWPGVPIEISCNYLLALLQHLLQDLLLAVEDDQVGLGHEDLLQHVPVPVLVVRQLLHHNSEVLRGNV